MALWIDDSSGYLNSDGAGAIGIAWVMDKLETDSTPHQPHFGPPGWPAHAYMSFLGGYASSDYTFATEFGHILGAAHDREHVDASGIYSYSYGYRFTGNDGELYHDIIDYDPGITVPYYANPNVSYEEGYPPARPPPTLLAPSP